MANMTRLTLLFLLWFSTMLAWSRPVGARFVLPDGQEFTGRFLVLHSDSVFYEVADGDTNKQMSLYKLDLKKVQILEDQSLVDLSLSHFEVTTQLAAVEDTVKHLETGKMTLIVESDPADARVYVDDLLLEGLTPLVIPNLANKEFKVMARKYLRGVDWWGETRIKQEKKEDTLRVRIKLEKPRTLLTIQSNPSEAEIYIDTFPSLERMPNLYSNTTIVDIEPGPDRSITLFKVGYYDTTVNVSVEAFMPNLLGVNLRPIDEDLQKLQSQIDFVSARKRKYIGRGLTWASIAPWIGAGVLWVMAEKDWKEAVKYKDYYADAAFVSSETESFIENNKKYNDSGDLKMSIAAGSAALGLLLSSLGVILQF